MTIRFELLGVRPLGRNLNAVEREVFPKANSRALNRAGMKMRTESVRHVSKAMGIKQKDVRDRVRLMKATPAKPSARLDFEGSAFNLIRFKARQLKKGVKAAPWGDRKLYPRSFVATINGTKLVMIREKKGGHMVGRLPIRPMLGPGIAKIANEPKAQAVREDVMRTVYPSELERQLRMMVERVMRRR
jgi:hypothetical protein